MPLVHLWSGLILNIVKLDNHPTDSNAPVENWFRIVKYSVFDGKIDIKDADFIRQIYPNIQERVAALRFGFEAIAKKIFVHKKRKLSQVSTEEELVKKNGLNERNEILVIYTLRKIKLRKHLDNFLQNDI